MGIILTMPDQMTLVIESSVVKGHVSCRCTDVVVSGAASCLASSWRHDSLVVEIAAFPGLKEICLLAQQAGCLRWRAVVGSTPAANHQELMIQISRRIKKQRLIDL